MKKLKSFSKLIIALIVLCLSVMYFSNKWVANSTQESIYSSVNEIPKNKVGLLLGTGKFLQNGNINLYYKYRIEATIKLYQSGKIEFVLISGDNSRKDYDEPSAMKNDLIASGIPANKIYLDYAGFRTLDSVVRCKEIFGQESITVISQQFHNERAIFIAEKNEISAVGFNAKNVSQRYGIKVQIREKLARVKVVLDLIFGIEPKFLGDKIEII